MSGHSKWSTIKRQKGAADLKRGLNFTKLGNAITIAVREGGGADIVSNFRLRLAIEKARGFNMPNDNIQRAIDRGLGKGAGVNQLDSVTYEAYAPGKVAIVISAATDNKNRTTAEIKSMIEKSGGSFVAQGAVSWMFSDVGEITILKNGKTFDELFEVAVNAGASDVEDVDDEIYVFTDPQELEKVKIQISNLGIKIENAELIKKPTTFVEISDVGLLNKILTLVEKLEEHDDVQKVYSNLNFIGEQPN